MKFSDVIDAYNKGDIERLQKEFPLHVAILDMAVDHVPNPVEAQKYRIPKIWRGDINSPIGQAMLNCDENGPLVICVNKVIVDPHAGPVVTGRIFSGTIHEGEQLYGLMSKSEGRVQQVSLYMGPYREICPEMSSGNIVALLGLDNARAGETLVRPADKEAMFPFEKMKYISAAGRRTGLATSGGRRNPTVSLLCRPMSTSSRRRMIRKTVLRSSLAFITGAPAQ